MRHGAGQGSGESEPWCRPGLYLFIAHQEDLDVRQGEASFLTDAGEHVSDGEAGSGQGQGGGAVGQVHAAVLPWPAVTLPLGAPKALSVALILGGSGRRLCAGDQCGEDRGEAAEGWARQRARQGAEARTGLGRSPSSTGSGSRPTLDLCGGLTSDLLLTKARKPRSRLAEELREP